VAGGVAAIAAVAAGAFDVVLMDMMMPEVDGPTASRAIRKLRGPQANIYIIALTANASLEHQRQCTAAGMNDFLTKPVARPRMEEALARYRDSQRR
jgi:CheY-like chemotaxis protein